MPLLLCLSLLQLPQADKSSSNNVAILSQYKKHESNQSLLSGIMRGLYSDGVQMEFSSTGKNDQRDFWLVDNQKHWALVPSGTIYGFDTDLPICLQTGTPGWGKMHIELRHSGWLGTHKKTTCELLYEKLGQPGSFYSTEEEGKLKLIMRLAPDALLALRYIRNRAIGDFLTIITMYRLPRQVDGMEVGRYMSDFRSDAILPAKK